MWTVGGEVSEKGRGKLGMERVCVDGGGMRVRKEGDKWGAKLGFKAFVRCRGLMVGR